uniref:Caerulein-4.2/4.2Y4 n=1 Tax=Ranoidea citropa TaxID=94770 RepID=CAE42_RANCI|nr:RecName: Full=Caerulein-4.2/4.2Y4 [Ranoidea citropa]
QQDYTGSHFDF